MRLLERDSKNELVLHEFGDEHAPAYAILSHTWAADKEEVSYQDVEAGINKCKVGYKKLQFCAEWAAADGLRYFWVDTCCIDKRDNTELSKAITSMFRWYQKAARCYVYLSDVPMQDGNVDTRQPNGAWELAFRKSRWFTRGWTLQELIAPNLVEFFNSEGERLGNKLTLEVMIYDVTGIPISALRQTPLSKFSINEQMSWAAHRHTKEPEDEAYCLIGMFDISMPLLYGEGRQKALKRLHEEINKSFKGADFDQFAISLNLSAIPKAAQFVAREKELIKIHHLLHGHSTQSTVVLHGLGGIGKTQLAIAYAQRHKEKYTAIFWANANNADSLKLSFLDIARQIARDQPTTSISISTDSENLDDVVNAVKIWLNLPKNAHWLFIYDNYDNPRLPDSKDRSTFDLRRFLPESDHGSIIITTRSSKVTLGQRIQLKKLVDVSDGLEILSNISGRHGIVNDPTAVELAKELDGLPLALATAGAYLEQMATTFSEYLQLYKASWLKLQTNSPQLISYEDRSLHTTWQLSLDQIEQQNMLSARLLKLWAYFDRQDVWFELLQHGHSANHDWMQLLIEDKISFNAAVRMLCNYGLVDADASLHEVGSGGYSMHSCVYSWTVSVLNKDWDESLARLALTCTASEVPHNNDNKWWLLQRRLLAHAMRHAHFVEDSNLNINGMEWTLHSLGNLYADQGKLAEAEKMYMRALQGYEEALGPKHTLTLDTVNNLGVLYAKQGKLAEAEEMYMRALQGREEALGSKHTSTLDSIHCLAILRKDQGKLAEAETMYMRALQGYEEALGSKHTSTLDMVNNLGNLYADQGKLAEAEKMYMRALQGKEEALGSKHTSTLMTVNNLGNLYADQGKLAEAEKMYMRALQGYEEALGSKHTSTLMTVNNLGNLYADQGKLAEAEEMYIRALQGYNEALGSNTSLYVPALNTTYNLGNLYTEIKKKDMAKTMYSRALSGFTAVQGCTSDMCQEIERRMAVLEVVHTELEAANKQKTLTNSSKLKSQLEKNFEKLRIKIKK
ncbi:MAG: hypothetical protein Q9165_007981 [Trypethelium subeluteriae]